MDVRGELVDAWRRFGCGPLPSRITDEILALGVVSRIRTLTESAGLVVGEIPRTPQALLAWLKDHALW